MTRLRDIVYFVVLCARNVWRDRKRSLLTVLAVFVATLILTIAVTYVQMVQFGTTEILPQWEYGDLQVSTSRFFNQFLIPNIAGTAPELSLRKDSGVLIAIAQAKSVEVVSPRLYVQGTISCRDRYSSFSAISGSADNEIFMLPQAVQGQAMSSTDPSGLVIGQKMMASLQCAVGDEVVLASPIFHGRTGAFHVRGVYFDPMFDQRNIVLIPIEGVWQILGREPFDSIAIKSAVGADPVAMKTDLSTLPLLHSNDLAVRTSGELSVFYRGVSSMMESVAFAFALVLAILVVFNINNTLFIVIANRMREIGVIRAIGGSRSAVVVQFVVEGLVIGIVGAGLSCVLSSATIRQRLP